MGALLRRYAYPQARIRARLARLLQRAHIETLAGYPDLETLERELAAIGWADPDTAVVAAYDAVGSLLDGAPRRVIEVDRQRFELRNLAVLLRAVEQRTSWRDVEPLLLPVGALGAGPRAAELARAASLAELIDHLPSVPFGEALRRAKRSAGSAPLDRFRLELLSERNVYESLWAAASALDRPDRDGTERLLGLRLDVVNLLRAARLHEHADFPPEEILALAIRGGRWIGPPERRLLATEPPERWAPGLGRSPYAAALAPSATRVEQELALARLLGTEANRAVAATPFGLALVLGYLALVELQARDVRRLLAARRLRRPEAWARAGLVAARAA